MVTRLLHVTYCCIIKQLSKPHSFSIDDVFFADKTWRGYKKCCHTDPEKEEDFPVLFLL